MRRRGKGEKRSERSAGSKRKRQFALADGRLAQDVGQIQGEKAALRLPALHKRGIPREGIHAAGKIRGVGRGKEIGQLLGRVVPGDGGKRLTETAGAVKSAMVPQDQMADPGEKTFFDVGADDIQKEFDLNMRGTWLPSKVMTPLLIGQPGACVLNVSSMSAFTPLTRIPGYSGAKAGVSNFTQWLATYLARSGVRVNAIAPGFFMTEQNHALQFNPDGTPTPRCAHIVNGTPMRRYGELKELIGAMLFLVDERAASFVTGVVLPVDGGYSAFSGV